MTSRDFFKFKNGCKARNKKATNENVIPTLENIRSVEFRKGCWSMFYKENIDDEEFKESTFLTKKFKLEIPERGKEDRGINAEKLEKRNCCRICQQENGYFGTN